LRTIIIVLDGVGCGSMPDAELYGDHGANTLAHVAQAVGGLQLPHLQSLGLGNILPLHGVAPTQFPLASYGKMAEKSPGKDTITGHWEIAGMRLYQPFAVYPMGFPQELIMQLEQVFQRSILGNFAASGTEIIEQLGREHQESGKPIVYTSADSVLQIATHTEVVPLSLLYHWCEQAREICRGKFEIARIIARPFVGLPGQYQRTSDRHDYPLEPKSAHLLTLLEDKGVPVYSVGKIEDIFVGQGVSKGFKTKDNVDGIEKTIKILVEEQQDLFLFTNLVEFDSLWGHRNNPQGFADALQTFDCSLPRILNEMNDDDMLIITADHGTDPTWPGTDHTREYIPLLVFGKKIPARDLGIRSSFADLATTIAQRHGSELPLHGEIISLL
jgi:phosphopentomutase